RARRRGRPRSRPARRGRGRRRRARAPTLPALPRDGVWHRPLPARNRSPLRPRLAPYSTRTCELDGGMAERPRGGENGPVETPREFDVSLRNVAVAVAPEGIGESVFVEDSPAELLEAATGSSDVALEFRRTRGMIANAFMSVSLAPPLILISIDRRAKLNALLHEGARYGVSVLEEHQSSLSDRFAGRL